MNAGRKAVEKTSAPCYPKWDNITKSLIGDGIQVITIAIARAVLTKGLSEPNKSQ